MLRLRKRLDCLTKPERARLAEAFRALMLKSDPTSNYAFWAGIHTTSCPHGCEQFLPWHRAYLVEFETALQHAIGDPSVMLPYWNWTVVRGIPEWLDVPPFASTRDPLPPPAQLPSPGEVQSQLALRRFDDFGGGQCPTSYPGGLENTHSKVHNWVRGFMGEAKTAAQDPIFWFHHAYVDALWLQWQHTHTEAPLGLDALLPGVPGRWTVRETLNVRSPRLDYDYIACQSEHSLDGWTADHEPRPVELHVPPHVTAIRFIARGIAALGKATPAALVVTSDRGTRVLTTLSLFGVGHHHDPHGHSHGPHTKESAAAGWLFLEGDVTRARDLPFRLEWDWANADPAFRGPVHVRSLTVQMVDALVARP